MSTVEQTELPIISIPMPSSEDIQSYREVIEYYLDENNHGIAMNQYLKKWAANKFHIFQLFGDKLKIEKDVECTLSESQILNRCRDFRDNELAADHFAIVKYFLGCLSSEELQMNITVMDRTIFGAKFKTGMKVSRIIGKLVPKQYASDLQTKFSMLVQSFKAKGKAVISIDPMDYLTMSVNNAGWRSCHAIDGEYRAGILAYLIDKVTAIAYIKTDRDIEVYGSKFSDKIWRQVVYVQKDNIFAVQSKEYPNRNTNNRNTVTEILKSHFNGLHGELYTSERVESKEVSGVLVANVSSQYGDRLWYNDVTSGSTDHATVVYPESYGAFVDFQEAVSDSNYNNNDVCDETNNPQKILVGASSVPCLCGCGNKLENSGYLYAENQYDDYDYDEDYDEEEDW